MSAAGNNIPAFAPFPPAKFQREIVPQEWEACLDSWLTLADFHLRSSSQEFSSALVKDRFGLAGFLASYFCFISHSTLSEPFPEKTSKLRKHSFLLCHRSLSEDSPPVELLRWGFLADFCREFPRTLEVKKLLSGLWDRKGQKIEADLQEVKDSVIKSIDAGSLDSTEPTITQLTPLLHVSYPVAGFFMVGSDLLDSFVVSYSKATPDQRKALALFTYLGLASLILSERPNFSLLSDHLYSIKSSTPQVDQPSLLSDLAINTPLVAKITETFTGQESNRARKLVQALGEYRQSGTLQPKRPVRWKVDKGKAKATDEFGHGAFGDVHVHRMSLITQIQDLFPDLGQGFIMRLLDEYNEDVEQVTAHLLDDSLPTHLHGLDRNEQISSAPHEKDVAKDLNASAIDFVPSSLPDRRNVFDNDELDNLAVDTSRLHIGGRKAAKKTADDILADRTQAPNKAAILSALARFDSDDDERDDTYDVEDVGGTVDSTFGGNGDADVDVNEEALFMAYRLSSDTFNRDAITRRGKARSALKSETGMTDEAIEGWGIMTSRDPRKLRRLEAKYATFAGQQTQLERTSYRENNGESGTEGEEQGSGSGFSGRGRGRGRGRGGGGRGSGNAAGPSGDAETAKARQRKDTQKGSRANHNRRDQRAKKMARGGFPG